MKHSITKTISFLFFALLSKFAFSQTAFDYTIDSLARELNRAKPGTFLTYRISVSGAIPSPKSIDGLGNGIIFDELFLFYSREHKLFAQKFINCFFPEKQTSGIEGYQILKSAPIHLNDDSLLLWVNDNVDTISGEIKLPFIYKQNINGVEIFQNGGQLHSKIVDIKIYNDSNILWRSINLSDCEENLFPKEIGIPAKNLNYSYNTSTMLFKLYSRIEGLLDPISHSFRLTR